MKKAYLEPEAEMVPVITKTTIICASADNLTVNKSYLEYEESEFWD